MVHVLQRERQRPPRTRGQCVVGGGHERRCLGHEPTGTRRVEDFERGVHLGDARDGVQWAVVG